MPSDWTVRMIVSALEGAASNLRRDFGLGPRSVRLGAASREPGPPDDEGGDMGLSDAIEHAGETVGEFVDRLRKEAGDIDPDPPATPEACEPAKKKRTIIRVKDRDRRWVACSDNERRRWFAGNAMIRWARRAAKSGLVERAFLVDAVVGLGKETAHRYYGDNPKPGVLLSVTERELYMESPEHPSRRR